MKTDSIQSLSQLTSYATDPHLSRRLKFWLNLTPGIVLEDLRCFKNEIEKWLFSEHTFLREVQLVIAGLRGRNKELVGGKHTVSRA